jgi:hypothetical protein
MQHQWRPSPAPVVVSPTLLQLEEDLPVLVAALAAPAVSPATPHAPASPSMEMKLEQPLVAPVLPVVDTSLVLQPLPDF